MSRAEERVFFDRPGDPDVGCARVTASHDAYRETILRIRDTILGMECRLEREASEGRDTTLGHLSLSREYADYARRLIERVGGNVNRMKTLTDRDNVVPLCWKDGDRFNLD